jgi:hypothetical protein
LSIFGKIRDWFRGQPGDPETEAAARKMHDDQATVRVSQTGSASPMTGGAPPSANIPPTPDVLDPDADDR